jgi:hypothetical protein
LTVPRTPTKIEHIFYLWSSKMIDFLLNIGSAFDWISPSVAFIQDLYYGPVHDFIITADAGWSRSDIRRLLKQHGVQVWGFNYSFNGKELIFTVPREQADYAYYLLQNAGDPLLDEIEEYVHSPT